MVERNKRLVAVVVLGEKNATRITNPTELTDAILDKLAAIVRRKDPNRNYYLMEMLERRTGFDKGDVLYDWHVGDGFSHEEGWWIRADD